MSHDTIWVIGSGGLLGSAVTRSIGDRADMFPAPSIDWQDTDRTGQLARSTDEFVRRVDGSPWSVIWCAGAGIIGTPQAALQRETDVLTTVLAGLEDCGTPGRFFLASSAGGVYEGSPDVPITESSDVAPLSDYGRNKLRQEQIVTAWTAATGNRAALGRISNLYGPGQSLTKKQGLISQVCLATMTRHPVSLHVSLDTIRDYLYVDDCAQMVLDLIDHLDDLPAGTAMVKIIASGHSASIGAVLGETRRVVGRAPTILMPPSTRGPSPGTALAFRSHNVTAIDRRQFTSLPTGIAATAQSVRTHVVSGSPNRR